MRKIPDGSVDMVLCDLPYGITQNKWDIVIPVEQLWEQYRRITKPNAAIVLTANQPFTSALVLSNPSWFRYQWVWDKGAATGHLNAKRTPMKQHEDVLVFCEKPSVYNPQGLQPFNKTIRRGGQRDKLRHIRHEELPAIHELP
jgi:site-specific DNA-methyltransferase (adenine-specific)